MFDSSQSYLLKSQLLKPLRTLDALHLAIVSDKELQLVTSDKSFANAAEMLDLNTLLITNKP